MAEAASASATPRLCSSSWQRRKATGEALVGWAGEKGERAKAEIPVGRFAQPVEIAAAARYLASDQAGIVNGAVLMADGGFSIR